jgi:hypothetical protein
MRVAPWAVAERKRRRRRRRRLAVPCGDGEETRQDRPIPGAAGVDPVYGLGSACYRPSEDLWRVHE